TDPLYIEPGSFISLDGAQTVDDLVGRRVGTIQGYNWVGDINDLLGGDLVLYPSSVELKQDLEAGRLDVAIASSGTALEMYEGTVYEVHVMTPDERGEAATITGQVGYGVTSSHTV